MVTNAFVNYGKKEFVLQWHLTDACDMRCSHCYIPHNNKKMHNSIATRECKRIINSLCNLSDKLSIQTRINFSGGNPLLREDFFEIAGYASGKGIKVGILGNPTSLLSEKVIDKLKEINVFRYQISIDGLKENHEKIRGKGSYDVAMKGIDVLIENEIPAVVLTTITKDNMTDIPRLAEVCFRKGVSVYDFARLVPVGESRNCSSLMPTPSEYHRFLYEMYNTYLKIKKEKPRVHFGVKDPLWMLLYSELGLLKPLKNDELIYGGCSIGITELCIDTKGIVYSCRRLEIPVGNALREELYDIFINSKELNKQRDFDKIEYCNNCSLSRCCRGCRAVAYAISGSYFSRDPQCWKENGQT